MNIEHRHPWIQEPGHAKSKSKVSVYIRFDGHVAKP